MINATSGAGALDALRLAGVESLAGEVLIDISNGADHTIVVSGDDAGAKDTVIALPGTFGWSDITDLGGLSTARGTEMPVPIWLGLMNALGTPPFNFKISR